MVDPQFIEQGRALVDIADQSLEHDVASRIVAAREFFDSLRPDELEARRALSMTAVKLAILAAFPSATEIVVAEHPFEVINCPSCNERIALILRPVRFTNERLEAGQLVRDIVYVAVALSCPICDLQLGNTAEIRAAKIKQQYVKQRQERLEDRFVAGREDLDND
jgi:hypothetical protein